MYEALSYAWGDPAVTKSIKLQGLEWYVITNLEVALRHLRHPHKERLLWIHAICLNQYDLSERNSQVMLMGSVYYQAKSVRIWLGKAADNSDSAILNLMLGGHYLDMSHLNAINKLRRRPRWKRVWIQQEFTLAIESVFHCGSKRISERSLAYFGAATSPPF